MSHCSGIALIINGLQYHQRIGYSHQSYFHYYDAFNLLKQPVQINSDLNLNAAHFIPSSPMGSPLGSPRQVYVPRQFIGSIENFINDVTLNEQINKNF